MLWDASRTFRILSENIQAFLRLLTRVGTNTLFRSVHSTTSDCECSWQSSACLGIAVPLRRACLSIKSYSVPKDGTGLLQSGPYQLGLPQYGFDAKSEELLFALRQPSPFTVWRRVQMLHFPMEGLGEAVYRLASPHRGTHNAPRTSCVGLSRPLQHIVAVLPTI